MSTQKTNAEISQTDRNHSSYIICMHHGTQMGSFVTWNIFRAALDEIYLFVTWNIDGRQRLSSKYYSGESGGGGTKGGTFGTHNFVKHLQNMYQWTLETTKTRSKPFWKTFIRTFEINSPPKKTSRQSNSWLRTWLRPLDQFIDN